MNIQQKETHDINIYFPRIWPINRYIYKQIRKGQTNEMF